MAKVSAEIARLRRQMSGDNELDVDELVGAIESLAEQVEEMQTTLTEISEAMANARVIRFRR